MLARDDVSGTQPDAEKVQKARQEEMRYFEDMQVYRRVDRSQIAVTNGKGIDTRWIDINKGDALNPVYRSRLVGREYRTTQDNTLYTATPPLEALRLVTSWAATHDNNHHSPPACAIAPQSLVARHGTPVPSMRGT